MFGLAAAALQSGCDAGTISPGVNGNRNNSNSNDNGDEPGPNVPTWRTAFDTSTTGVLSSAWGSGPDDVFVVGGTPEQGEVYHYDGSAWREMPVPAVPLLVWVYGFGPDDVMAVGEGGGVIRFNGSEWTALDSGTEEDLWGVWGSTPSEMWIVGGNVGDGDPVLLLFDGGEFTPVPVPENDRAATSLFKVYGVGGKVFAVGENGLILEYAEGAWVQVPAGPEADDDFVSLWGISADRIVAVGGRGAALVARYDGTEWSTTRYGSSPGLNAVYMNSAGETIVGGQIGFAAKYELESTILSVETTRANLCIHSIWGDEAGVYYAVGGQFSEPFEGLALVRSEEPPDPDSGGVPIGSCAVDDDCLSGQICTANACMPGARCTADDDCGEREQCVDELCEAVPGEPCEFQSDCALGEECAEQFCQVTRNPDVEYRVSFGGEPEKVAEGGDIPVIRGFQGGIHTFVTLRATQLNFEQPVELEIEVSVVGGPTVIGPRTASIIFEEVEPGIGVVEAIFIPFVGVTPTDLEGQEGLFSITVIDTVDRTLSASLSQSIRFREFVP